MKKIEVHDVEILKKLRYKHRLLNNIQIEFVCHILMHNYLGLYMLKKILDLN